MTTVFRAKNQQARNLHNPTFDYVVVGHDSGT
jgi:hypothetical protein